MKKTLRNIFTTLLLVFPLLISATGNASDPITLKTETPSGFVFTSDLTRELTITQNGTNNIDCNEGANLAENAIINDFSSEQNTTNGVTNLVDGDNSTTNRWSAETFPQYAVIDLGAQYNVNEINLYPYADRAYQFTVEGSTSSTSGYTTLVDATDNASGGSLINRTFTSSNVRYIKLTITGASGYTGDWSSITEFEVLCAGEVIPNSLAVSSISEFDADGETQSVNVTSNVDWAVTESSSWLSVNNTSGSNNGSFSITASENTSTSERSGDVTVTGGGITETITVTQEGQEDIIITNCTSPGTNLAENATISDFSSEQNTTNGVANLIDGDISTTNRWSAETFPQHAVIDLGAQYNVNEINLAPYADRAYQFIVEGSLSSSSSGFLTLVDATDNTTGESLINRTFTSQNVRYVKLTITGASGYTGNWSSVKEFEILCTGEALENSLVVSSISEFDADGESQSVNVTSNVNWSVNESDSWLSVNNTSGSNNGSFTITATENTSTTERSGSVTVTGSGITETITVTQEGQEDIIITPTECSGGANLAENTSIVDFSSEQNSTNGVTNLIDGNDSNRWSAETFPQYAVIDLGAVYEVDEINLVPFDNRAYQFLVEGAVNSATSGFNTLTDATGNTSGGSLINKTFDSQNVRYVKLTITGASGYTGDWSSIKEFEVICAGEIIEDNRLSISSINSFSANGDNQSVDVSSNVDWTVSENSSWISITNDNGSNDGSFTINASVNTGTSFRSATVTVTGASLSETISVNQLGAIEQNGELDPSKAPSENFDLSQWYLSVPIDNGENLATTIKVSELNDEYELKNHEGRDYFYTGADGGMVFVNYPMDAPKTSSNTTYSRNELREMLSSGSTNSTKYPINNWWFSSSDDIPHDANEANETAGGIDGVLTATLKVNHVTETSDSSSQVGRIIVGQIHASSNEPNRLYYHKQPNHDKGAIYVCHEDYDGNETFYNIIGNYVVETGSKAGDYSGADEPSDGIELNEEFSYKIEVIGNDQWVTISRPGKSDVTVYIDMSDSGYENDWMYFKAGIYSQNKTTSSSSDYDQVTFYKLKQTHNGSSSKNLTKALIEDITVYPNPYTETINISLGEDSFGVKSVAIADGLGRVILSENRKENENLIQLSGNFNTGIYYLQLLDINGTVIAVRKVIRN